MRVVIYRISVFECFSVDRENAANTTYLTHSTWLSFQYENASSNVLVWMRPQLFSFVADLSPSVLHSRNGEKACCKAGKYKKLSNPTFFLTLPKTDRDISVRNFAMISICACTTPSAARPKCSRVNFFFFFFS